MDMYDHLDMHITTSMNVFYFGLGWCFTTHLAMKHGNEKGKRFRYASVSLGFIAFTIMMTAMTLAINEHPSFLETNDMDLIQSWVNWAAPMEYLLVISFILTLKSFEIDIQEGRVDFMPKLLVVDLLAEREVGKKGVEEIVRHFLAMMFYFGPHTLIKLEIMALELESNNQSDRM